MGSDAAFMRLALGEAKKSDPFPNPKVGAVVVRNGKVLAAGHHEFSGGPHAEIAAMRNARAGGKSPQIRGSTLYATLEPCSHTGKKTPPCTDAIVRAGIRRVVVGALDANPSVNSVALLRQHGVLVKTGVLARECAALNRRINASFRQGMPIVAARFAMSLDGKIATRTGHSKWITGPAARAHSRRLRGAYDVLLVGSNTVLADNPLLTCRTPGMPEPLRVICDSRLRTNPRMRVFSVLKDKILAATSEKRDKRREAEFKRAGIAVLICGRSRVNLRLLMRKLFAMGKRSVLIEGGGELIGSAFDARLVERIYAFIAPKIIGGERAVSPVRGRGVAFAGRAARLAGITITRLSNDLLIAADVVKK